MTPATLVLGVIGMDVHAVGNKILEYTFSSAGFQVVNLGVMVSQEEFINAAIETAADAIIVSSLYGHGELDCRGLRDKCIEAGIGDILLYAGGNLVVGKTPFEVVEQRFKAMGFNRVYPPGTAPEKAIEDLRRDLRMFGQRADDGFKVTQGGGGIERTEKPADR
jgi:methylaspartate mutase sigma subunit